MRNGLLRAGLIRHKRSRPHRGLFRGQRKITDAFEFAQLDPMMIGPGPPDEPGLRRQSGGGAESGNIAALTAVRGVAAWWVVFFHFREYLPHREALLGFAKYGYTAVDLFFVLSGFVIALNYLPRFDPPRFKTYIHFLGLRLARIYPLHGFMLLLFLINPLAIMLAGSLPPDPVRYAPVYYSLSVFLVQNWGFTPSLAWNVPAWSISTEWLAYLVFPVVAWLALRLARSARGALLMVAVALIALAAGFVVTGESLGGDIARNGLPRCLLEFSAGAFLYRIRVAAAGSRTLGEIASVACIALLAGYLIFPVEDYAVFPLAWCCLIYALTERRSLLSRLLSGKVVETIGEYSYATYMAHYFIRDWVKFLLVRDGIGVAVQLTAYVLATALASVILYRWIEVPGRRRLRAWFGAAR